MTKKLKEPRKTYATRTVVIWMPRRSGPRDPSAAATLAPLVSDFFTHLTLRGCDPTIRL